MATQPHARFKTCITLANLVSSWGMTLDDAIRHIEQCCERMNANYGATVFDEWLVVHMGESDKILAHSGPRGDSIVYGFFADLKAIHDLLQSAEHSPGDFGFTHEGHGTRFDAYVVLGENLYLLWNKTDASTTHITKNPRWQIAQSEFIALTDAIRQSPLIYLG